MKIRKLQLKNIGVFDDETIEFQPCPAKDKAEIHIFTGQNGSGKTTILQSFCGVFQNDELQEETKVERDYLEGYGDLIKTAKPKNKEEEKFLIPLTSILNALESRIKDKVASFSKTRTSFKKRFRYSEYDGKEDFIHQAEDKYKSQIKIILNDEVLVKIYKTPTWWNSVFSQISSNLIIDYGKLLNLREIPKQSLNFAVFAFSGYRQIEDEPVQANYLPKDFNPLSQSLEFIKDYRKEGEITINQLVANNISNRALSKEDNSLEEAKKYEAVINTIETFIKNVTDYEVKFVLKRSPNELKLKIHGEELDFDVLPDGLRSLISWIADLLGRVDLLKWQDDLPINEKNLILLLDEIEVHLHPEWQRKVLPVVQKLFKNSQIFVSTHSPFVVNSVDDAWVYKLKLDAKGKAKVESVERSEDARSYRYVLRNTFDIENEFGIEIERRLKDFYEERDKVLSGNGNSKKTKAELKKIADELSDQSKELKTKIDFELYQLSEITGEEF